MSALRSVSSFLDQNFYGFLLLLIAAYFYRVGEREGATAFFAAGAALIGVKKASATETTTAMTGTNPPTVTTVTGTPNA